MDQNTNSSLNQYYIFFVTASTGNLSLAAKHLYISQPAVSKSIKKIEEQLGTPLFIRSRKGVRMTPDGEILYSHLKDAFQLIHEGEDKIKNKEFKNRKIRIGVSNALCKYILLPKISEFLLKYPEIKIEIHCQSSVHTLNLLKEDEIDFGFIGWNKNTFERQSLGSNDLYSKSQQSFEFYETGEIYDCFVASEKYLTSFSTEGTFKTSFDTILRDGTFMLLDKENLTRKSVDQYLEKNDIFLKNIIEVSSIDLLIEFALAHLGIACVIKDFVQEELAKNILVEVPLITENPARKIGFVYLPQKIISSEMKEFFESLKK